jgi:serine/threonine-protein kinase
MPPGAAGGLATGQLDMAEFSTGRFGGDGGSHTLVVPREDAEKFPGRREPFLQRWLFSPRLLVVVLVLALGVGLGFGGWWMTSGRYGSVPQVNGDTVAVATTALTTNGFKVKGNRQVHSNQVPKGMVVGTSPSGRVAKGSMVTLLVSAGPFTSVVPKVADDSLSQAQATLQGAHLTYSTQKVASNAAVGTVVGTKPAAGTTWPQTQPVTILVSAGPPVPDFFGQNVQVAQQWASQHGVTLQQHQDPNSQQPQGTITGQEPRAGSTFQPGQTVTVDVSNGPAMVNVPDPIGLSTGQATQLLQAAGFKVQVNRYGPFDKVFDYSPVTPAPRGSTIIIDVGF